MPGKKKSRLNRAPQVSITVKIKMMKPHIVAKWAMPGAGPLQQLALPEHFRELGPGAARGAVEPARGGRAAADHLEQEEHPPTGYGECPNRQQQPDDQAYSHRTSQYTVAASLRRRRCPGNAWTRQRAKAHLLIKAQGSG